MLLESDSELSMIRGIVVAMADVTRQTVPMVPRCYPRNWVYLSHKLLSIRLCKLRRVSERVLGLVQWSRLPKHPTKINLLQVFNLFNNSQLTLGDPHEHTRRAVPAISLPCPEQPPAAHPTRPLRL